MSSTEPTPLQRLTEAVQTFVNSLDDEPAIVIGSVIAFETARYDDDGEQRHLIRYAVLGEAPSMSGAIGLFDAGHAMCRSDSTDDDTDNVG